MTTEDTLLEVPVEEEQKYAYIVKAENKTVRLKVEDKDVFINADGEIDCPMDRVLRKNGYSIYDLLSWTTKEVDFVSVEDGVVTVIRTIPLNVSLE